MITTAEKVIADLDLPEGPLEPQQLQWVSRAVAERRDVWVPHLDTSVDVRSYASLHRDDDVDVWALFWLPDNDTGWHDHDTSNGAVTVVEGAVDEHALRIGGPGRLRTYTAGQTFGFGPSHIHRMTCSVPRAVSIHAYSPPLWRLGQYSVDGEGLLARQSVSYADELRPHEAALAA